MADADKTLRANVKTFRCVACAYTFAGHEDILGKVQPVAAPMGNLDSAEFCYCLACWKRGLGRRR